MQINAQSIAWRSASHESMRFSECGPERRSWPAAHNAEQEAPGGHLLLREEEKKRRPPSAHIGPCCSPQKDLHPHLSRVAGTARRLLEAARKRRGGRGQRLAREGGGHERSHGGNACRL